MVLGFFRSPHAQQPRVCCEQEARCCSVSFAARMYQDFLMYRVSLVAQTVKNLPAIQETGFNPWIEKISWRRKWQPTPVFLLEKSHGQKSLAWGGGGHKESETTEATEHAPNS